MGRSQVLYNRTKGRFRNRVRQQSQETPQQHNKQTDSRRRTHHRSAVSETEQEEKEDRFDDAPSSSKRSSRMRETEMLLLAESRPQYYIQANETDDDAAALFRGSKTSSSSSTLDVASLETTLLTCITMSERLQIPPHVAETLQPHHDYASLKVDTIPSADGTDAELLLVPSVASTKRTESQSVVPPANTDTAAPQGSLRRAPSQGHHSSRMQYTRTRDDDDAMSYSVGPNKVRTTQRGDIEVRIKPSYISQRIGANAIVDEASRHSQEYDVDGYAAGLGDPSQDCGDNNNEEDDAHTYPPLMTSSPILPNPRDRVSGAALAARTRAPMDPPSQQQQHRQYAMDHLAAQDDSQLENWLDSVTSPNEGKSYNNNVSMMPQEVSFPQKNPTRTTTPVLPIPSTQSDNKKPKAGVTATPPIPMGEEGAEESLDAWLDDVIS
eukprot:scaffold14558_cov137-Cylindrotheca_fusiformis.AAC.17